MKLAFLVLTEDKDEALRTWRPLLGHLLRRVDAQVDLRPTRVQIDPPDHGAALAMRSNGWKEARNRERRLQIARSVRTWLHRADRDGWVVLHVDGDLAWGESGGGKVSKNLEQLEALLLPEICKVLEAPPKGPGVDRVLVLVPFYSIESWLFQNGEELRRIYDRRYPHDQRDRTTLKAWVDEPGLLDEIEQIKEQLHIKDTENEVLAQTLRPAQVEAVGKSFAAAVAVLRAHPDLVSALARARYDS